VHGVAQVVFIASESDIKQDVFAEYINQILKTGEISGLYTRDEFEAVCAEVTPIMQRAGLHSFCFRIMVGPLVYSRQSCDMAGKRCGTLILIGDGHGGTPKQAFKFFIEQVKRNLHIVLCMSPGGNNLMRRAQQFPGLVSGTYVDWYMPWPTDALALVAHNMLHDLGLPNMSTVSTATASAFRLLVELSSLQIIHMIHFRMCVPGVRST
jgi:dynein heavy chain, axonemal